MEYSSIFGIYQEISLAKHCRLFIIAAVMKRLMLLKDNEQQVLASGNRTHRAPLVVLLISS